MTELVQGQQAQHGAVQQLDDDDNPLQLSTVVHEEEDSRKREVSLSFYTCYIFELVVCACVCAHNFCPIRDQF